MALASWPTPPYPSSSSAADNYLQSVSSSSPDLTGTQPPSPSPSLSLPSLVPSTTGLPVMGLPGINFWILHITAEVSLGISIVSSVAVFAILRPTCPGFWSRSIGERFAVYLALGDLLYSISHVMDHATMLVLIDHPPDGACTAMAYFVSTFVMVQALMVTFMSLNAYTLVVKERKISLGRYDWKFLVGTVGCPIGAMMPFAILGFLGPGGGWCVYDVRTEGGRVLGSSFAFIQLITILINVISYVLIYYKIKRVTAATAAMGHKGDGKYRKSAQVMMKFVAAFIFQWWTHVIYAFWNLIVLPPFVIIHAVVLLVNMGGLYNLIVYTLLKRQPKAKKQTSGQIPEVSRSTQNSSVTNTSEPVSSNQ